MKKSLRNENIGILYISPWIIGFLIFTMFPLMASFYFSFTKYSLTRPPQFVWFKNYIDFFLSNRESKHAFFVTFKYALMAVPIKLIAAMIFALLLDARLKFTNFYTTVFYLPSILLGSVGISILWKMLFMPEGIINSLIGYIGLEPIKWITSPKLALFTVSLLNFWAFGSSMIVFLAGLKQIPEELLEASRIDGASRLKVFLKIKLPLLTPALFFNLIMQSINALQSFTSAFVITGGGPLKSTYLIAIEIYKEAFVHLNIGYASALSWILFLIIMLITLLIFKSSDAWLFYQNEEGKTKK